MSVDSLKQYNLFWLSELQREWFLIKAELQEGRGSAGPDYSLWRRCSLGHFLGMTCSNKEFFWMPGTWVTWEKCLLLPIAVPVSWEDRSPLHQWSGRAEAAIPTRAGRAGKLGCAWEKQVGSCCKEEAEQRWAGLLQSSVLPTPLETSRDNAAALPKKEWHYYAEIFLLFLLPKCWLLWIWVKSVCAVL